MNKLREHLAKAFLDALNEGALPWRKTWGISRPQNPVSGTIYHGVNALWLSMLAEERNYTDPRWCTFQQAKQKGWTVKKGSKADSAMVEFWSLYDKKTRKTISQSDADRLMKEDPDRKDDIILMSRTYTVFNAEQIDGIPEYSVGGTVDIESIRDRRDVLLTNMGVGFSEGGDSAYYRPSTDSITMPPDNSFDNTYSYMATFLHEAGHATGHETRMNRDLSGFFGTENYAKEELRAEIAATFTVQALGFGAQEGAKVASLNNHKAYIQSWIKNIEDQPNELFSAIKDAERISDYLLEKGEFLKDLTKEKQAPEKTPSLDTRILSAVSKAQHQSEQSNMTPVFATRSFEGSLAPRT